MKYYVSVTEALSKVVSVEAESENEAKELVQDAYDNGDIVLGADYFCGEKIDIDDDGQEYFAELDNKYGSIQEIKP